jgi:hypothetical protein
VPTVKDPDVPPSVMVAPESVVSPAEARVTAEPGLKLMVLLRVIAPDSPGAETLKVPPVVVLVMVPEMATFPVVAVAEKAPAEASVMGHEILMAVVPVALAAVIETAPAPAVVVRKEFAAVENDPKAAVLVVKFEAPGEPLENPCNALKEIFPPAVTTREGVALKVELFVRLPLKAVAPLEVTLIEFAELLVIAAAKVMP